MANENAEWFGHYHGCLGRFPLPKSGLMRPFMVGDSNDEIRSSCIITTISKKGNMKNLLVKTEELRNKAELFSPECKMVNGSKAAGYYSFEPARQFNKGIKNFAVLWFNGGERIAQHPDYVELGWAWPKEYPPFGACLHSVLNGDRISSAFDKYWAIGAYTGFDNPLIYYKGDILGELNTTEALPIIIIPKTHKMFNEYLNRTTGYRVVNE